MRRKIVAGNWKMNNDLPQTEILLLELLAQKQQSKAEVMVAPAFTNLYFAYKKLKGSTIEVISQNMHFAPKGAFTGEISAEMLKSVGVETTILGHSERRAYFFESDEILKKKVQAALENNMQIIFCVGEKLADRKENNHFTVVANQLKNALFHVPQDAFKNIIIAYEPVWAIGTGETATPQQAQEMHEFIRKTIALQYTNEVAQEVPILYGGSVKPTNAKEIFSMPDVDGGLIGGASLDATSFFEIVNAV
jgi:triosephosphate isomerase